jgi:hypothetical protein
MIVTWDFFCFSITLYWNCLVSPCLKGVCCGLNYYLLSDYNNMIEGNF